MSMRNAAKRPVPGHHPVRRRDQNLKEVPVFRRIEDEVLWNYEFGDHILAGKVPLRHWWNGVGKLVGLVAPAIQECFDAAEPAVPGDIPILLGSMGMPLDRQSDFGISNKGFRDEETILYILIQHILLN